MSRERLKALIRNGAVETQGRAIRDPAIKVRGGESLRVEVPEPTPAHNAPQDIPLKIVFEDEHLLVVDKAAGLVVHPAAGNLDGTLVNALLHHCGGSLSGIGGGGPPGGRPPAGQRKTRGPPLAHKKTARTRDRPPRLPP